MTKLKKLITTNSKNLATKIRMLREYGWKNRISELADCTHDLDFLGDKISIELYATLKCMASDVINMPSRWSGDLEEAMIIDILTSKIEPLWENFDAEWEKHCN